LFGSLTESAAALVSGFPYGIGVAHKYNASERGGVAVIRPDGDVGRQAGQAHAC
jgi:hypothetical protein